MALRRIEQDEFGRLVDQYRRELQAHCYRLMGTVHDAEDMVQETYLRAWRNRASLANPASLRAWLYRIATNACLDALKKHPPRFVPITREAASTLSEPIPAEVRDPVWLEPYPDHLLLADDHDPENYIVTRETITMAFIAAVHLLPPRQRAVVLLRDVLDWQIDEIATALNTTLSAVKSALHRARETLERHGYAPRGAREVAREVALDDTVRAQLDAYVRAWETADINTLTSLLIDDATFSMPPIPSWYRGRDTIRDLVAMTVFSGQAHGRWRLLPTRANRQIAFGLYRQTDVRGTYHAYGIQVLTVDRNQIADITTFRNPALFPYFKLPTTLDLTKRRTRT